MKKILIYISGFIILTLIATSVIAASKSDIVRANLISEKSQLKHGEEIVVTLKFDQYNKQTEAINCFQAVLDYDKEVFEKVVQANFRTLNNWESLKYNQETGDFVVIKKAGIKKDEEIIQITLKVKEGAKAGKYNITMGKIITSEGKEDLIIEDAVKQIDIIEEELPEVVIGDVNKDKKIDVFDARVILRKAAARQEFTDYEKQAGDVNFDGKVNVLDARRILMYSAKLITSFEKK